MLLHYTSRIKTNYNLFSKVLVTSLIKTLAYVVNSDFGRMYVSYIR